MFVYLIRNRINGKVYIGQTIKSVASRWSGHIAAANNGSNLHLPAAIRKYGVANFDVSTLGKYSNKEELDAAEIGYIKFYDACNREVGYNSASGGANGIPSEETRHKMSLAKLGKTHSERHNLRIGLSNKGKHRDRKTEDHCRKLGEFHKGKKHSLECRQKISASLIGNKRSLGYKHTPEAIAKISAAAKINSKKPRKRRFINA